MFLPFTNHIVNVLGPDLKVKLYTDDTKLYSVVDGAGSTDAVQRGLRKLCDWCTAWLMSIDVNKCFV